jgi:hypothetical protein
VIRVCASCRRVLVTGSANEAYWANASWDRWARNGGVLEEFSPRGEIDIVYLDTLYYLCHDGPLAIEALHVIDTFGQAYREGGGCGR